MGADHGVIFFSLGSTFNTEVPDPGYIEGFIQMLSRLILNFVIYISCSSADWRAIYRVVQKKGTVLLSTSLAWPAVAGCSWAETFSQLSSISFAQPWTGLPNKVCPIGCVIPRAGAVARSRNLGQALFGSPV